MRPDRIQISSALILIFLLLAPGCKSGNSEYSCTDEFGCVVVAEAEPVKIAALQVLSGENRSLGLDQIRAAKLVIEKWDGEILGHPIRLVEIDDLCSKAGGRIAANRIVSDPKIAAVFGSTCSGAAAPAVEILSKAGMSMISASNTAPSLTYSAGRKGADHYPGFFRTSPNDENQGRAAADFAFHKIGKRRAATIHDEDTYTKGLVAVFEKFFRELGGEIVLSTAVNKVDREMQPVLKAIAASGADFVFYALFLPAGSYLTIQAREMPSTKDISLMGSDTLLSQSYVESVKGSGIGVYIVGPASPENKAYQDVVALYRESYGEFPQGPFVAHACDAFDILLHAVENAAHAGKDGTLYIGRHKIRESLYAVSGFKGLTGDLSCNNYGDCGVQRLKVVRLDDPDAGLKGLASNIVCTYAYAP